MPHTSSFLKETQRTPYTLIDGFDATVRILERQLDTKWKRIAELARRMVLHVPLKSPGRQDQIPTAANADHGGQSSRGLWGKVAAKGDTNDRGPECARLSRAPRRAPPAPPLRSPHSLPRPSPAGSLKSPRTEMGVTAPGTSGNKTQRRPRGGRCGGEGPGTKPARADPRSPPPQRPHSPALDSAPSPPPAVQSRLKTAAPRAPRAASLPVRPAAPATRSERPLGPSRENGAEKLQPPPPHLPGTPGSGTTTPSRLRETNARGNGGSRGTREPNAPIRFVLHSCHFACTVVHLNHPKEEDADSGRWGLN